MRREPNVRARADPQDERRGPLRAPFRRVLEHARILVADDDPLLLGAVAEGLTRLGADVVSAGSGGELIEHLAHDGPFALVVTDISMPWMNGLQAMHSARTAGVGTAIIVMTALTDSRIPAQVQALGTNAILLRKPFQLSELEAAASKLLSPGQPSDERPS